MWRLLAIAVLAMAPFVVACADDFVASPGAPQRRSPPAPASAPSILIEPSPTHEPIGFFPDDCELGPEPVPVSDHVGDAIGGDPVWAIGFGGPAATLTFSPDNPYHDHGWRRKVLWLLRRSAADPVTVSGHRLDDGSPLWFAYQPGPQETVLLLDPDAPHGRHGDWYEYRGYFVVPSAGCYGLTAPWPGGGWELRFRAGLDLTARFSPND
jgi:hypothetical protein